MHGHPEMQQPTGKVPEQILIYMLRGIRWLVIGLHDTYVSSRPVDGTANVVTKIRQAMRCSIPGTA